MNTYGFADDCYDPAAEYDRAFVRDDDDLTPREREAIRRAASTPLPPAGAAWDDDGSRPF